MGQFIIKPIYDYDDYRRFLRERFSEIKRRNPSFSFRAFNRLAGFRSSATLKLVMDGKRNLAVEGIRRIARGFKLNEEESRYFRSLVFFNQAKDHEERAFHFQEINTLSGRRNQATE